MKRKMKNTMLAFIAMGTLMVAGCGSSENVSQTSGSNQEEMAVRIAYNLPKEHAVGVYFETLADEIEKRTEDTSIKLTAQTFSDGQLYNDTQMTDAISQGGVEIGGINAGMITSDSAQLLESFDMPFLFKSWGAEKAAIEGEYGQLISEDFEKLNVKVIGWAKYGTVGVYGNHQIRVPDDIEKKKMRSVGKAVTEWLEDTGASPTSMSSQEVFQAMERKMIDGFVTGNSSIIERSFFEVTKHAVDMNLTHTSFPAGANLDWWNGLPEDVQKAILEASEVAIAASRDKAFEDDKIYKEKMKENGMELYQPTGKELQAWYDSANTIQEEFAKKSDRAKQLIESVKKINEQYPAESDNE
ncbi:TRAP transporter substrate-binding protein [Lysinibacillus sp. BW-2-10]|uniref:TRAP transporter substrate-binding protein n=1 Tax=Lysinibacillus sp. BW-2-10 TaxID=2590030 RepID=UPI00117D3FA1|nr:TRAP transporter substrate-binding protein [Lysinibacillus sp. BW-2-10]TSI09303.1 TRAP transporter substrate-binding protein [Lysinibacillus sp. BW-2-10]